MVQVLRAGLVVKNVARLRESYGHFVNCGLTAVFNPKRIMSIQRIGFIALVSLWMACSQGPSADSLFYNGHIYSVDSAFNRYDAMVVHRGKILALGSADSLREIYRPNKETDLQGHFVYPGFIDAHCHFYGYGLSLGQVDLQGTRSYDDVLARCEAHYKTRPEAWLLGRGWDQNDWAVAEFPTHEKLDSLFPDVPVWLRRIDGHAGLANTKALELAGIDANTVADGGEVVLANGKPTGVLIDNAMSLMDKVIPAPDSRMNRIALLAAQKNCFAVGLTSVHDAGLSASVVGLIDSLQVRKELKMHIYAMLSPDSATLKRYLEPGPYSTHKLDVRSVKLYADGALGSRGAKLIEPYHDAAHTNGLLVSSEEELRRIYSLCAAKGFQANTHAIGDSANRMVLNLYAEYLENQMDLRWRVEHAQVVHPADFPLFGRYGIVPSVQPTHATSDMSWAAQRLGDLRVKGAYAYRQLLLENGWLPLGSDFPVEGINPLLGFYAAVARANHEGLPVGGWQAENALTREEALRGMTIWAARAGFEENERGSLEPGKVADFVILPIDLMSAPLEQVLKVQILATYSDGEAVFSNSAAQ